VRAWAAFAGVLLLASAFVLAHYGRRFTSKIKRRWQSLSAGVAVAYVFVQAIPELEEHRPILAGSAMGALLVAEKQIYLWALAGFVTFAGLTRLRSEARPHGGRSGSLALVYWGEMAGYAIYMLLIGYLLLHREDASLRSLWLYVFAMGLHIFMLDTELAAQFHGVYETGGRVVLVACLLLGSVLGVTDVLPASLTSSLVAFVIGGVVISSAHEELPAEGGRFWWFFGGAAFYATLLMLI